MITPRQPDTIADNAARSATAALSTLRTMVLAEAPAMLVGEAARVAAHVLESEARNLLRFAARLDVPEPGEAPKKSSRKGSGR